MSSSESGAQLKKLEAERARLAEELAELQAAIPTAQAVDDLAAFVVRTPEPMAAGGGAGADAAGRATASAAPEVKNPWMEPPVVEATCDCGAVWQRIRAGAGAGGGVGGGGGGGGGGGPGANTPRRPMCAPLRVTGCPTPPCCSVS